MISEHFELLDVYKAVASLTAGLILGFERELKDKSAGLKTITIICLGSTLFSILSYKLSGSGDPTRIASYIVSGIGFLGAGVIYKVGFNVYGLTTAGIIWIAAAVGMAIGFGEIFIAAVFLISAMAVINGAKVVTQQFIAYHQNKILKLSIPVENIDQKQIILNDLNRITKVAHEIGLEKEGNILNVTLDLHVTREQLTVMEMYLVTHPNITYFSF